MKSFATFRVGLLVPPLVLGVAAQASATSLDAVWVRLTFELFGLVCVMISTAAVMRYAPESHALVGEGRASAERQGAHTEGHPVGRSATREAVARPPTLSAMRRQPETVNALADRRLPTVERTTGLLAQWYFILRIEEEIRRAERYGQMFTVVSIETPTENGHREAVEYVTRTLRTTDLAGDMGEQITILLVQTAGVGSDVVIDRIRAALPSAAIHAMRYPDEGGSASELLGKGRWWRSELELGTAPSAA